MRRKKPIMEKSIYAIVTGVCIGYNARKKALSKSVDGVFTAKLTAERYSMYKEYMRLNDAVDKGLEVCDSDIIRKQIKRSLTENLSYEMAFPYYCGKNQFYRHKNAVIHAIAHNLNLMCEEGDK